MVRSFTVAKVATISVKTKQFEFCETLLKMYQVCLLIITDINFTTFAVL